MDLEAMQLLNLSPIPELSEIELSTMLDHLSGLSDINGDLTDRNVEDIIKEAEDLLDNSISSKTNESRDVKKSPEEEDKMSDRIDQDVNSLKKNEDCSIQESNEIKHYNNPVDVILDNTSNEESSKHFNSPVESTPTKVYSPGGTTNHIKSTIDSLKEFSTLIEKQLSSRSQNSPSKCSIKTKQKEKAFENKIAEADNPLNEKSVSTKLVSSCQKSIKTQDLATKKMSFDKSLKLLNCFERLYQVRPVRLSTMKKPKVVDKTPKTMTKKKLNKDFKNITKTSWQGKTVLEKEEERDQKICHHPLPPPSLEEDDSLIPSKTGLKYFISNNHDLSQAKAMISTTENQFLSHHCSDRNCERNNYRLIQSRVDEKLILKVLAEMEEIKDQVRKVGFVADGQKNVGTKVKEETGVDNGQLEVDAVEEGSKLSLEPVKTSGIKRLEQQLCILKEKYDYQMEKLEAENFRLREALNGHEKLFPPQTNTNISQKDEVRATPVNKITRSISLENCKVPRNSPNSSLENIHTATTVREAFSQTEDPKSGRREIGTNADLFTDARKTENKENVTVKKRPGKWKPFSDVNVYQSSRQKKLFEHESQLLATLRGLQAEVTAKDKENRKLRSDIESLRKQMKKLTGCKTVENCRKCHTGTQTLGLGPIVQKPYDPEIYEVSTEFEKENEDLRSRIRALEEDFELLKEKRISDLQALHQVHEEEMAKLVSKLETQSALTRHLHSLLVNR